MTPYSTLAVMKLLLSRPESDHLLRHTGKTVSLDLSRTSFRLQLKPLNNRNQKQFNDHISHVLSQTLAWPHAIAQEAVPGLLGCNGIPSFRTECVPIVSPDRRGLIETLRVHNYNGSGGDEITVDSFFNNGGFGKREPFSVSETRDRRHIIVSVINVQIGGLLRRISK